MKHTGIKRIFSAVLVVVLAVGLMPLPAFAETGSGQQEETPLAAAGSAALASGPEMTAQSYYSDQKEITGLGTGAISNPKFANGGWNKVYFGSNEDSGEAPLLFNVLNTHETCFGGDTMFLDCTKVLMNMSSGNFRNEFFHPGNQINKYLNNEFLQQRFTSGEQGAIAYSVKGGHAPGDGWGWVTDNGGWNSPFCPIGWADHARIFILDAHEATNASYGFAKDKNSTYHTESPTRAKTGTDTEWWTRSQYQGFNSYSCVTILHDGKFSYEHHSREVGVSPCLNVKLSSILYTSQVDTNTYKLTVKDDNIKVSVKDATKDFSVTTVPYNVTGKYSELYILLTDAEWTDSGWSNTDSEFIYLKPYERIYDWNENSTTGVCTFNTELLDLHPDYNAYLIAEMQNGDHETDYASAPVKLTAKQGIYRIANGYTGTYDGKAHGISVDVTFPGSGATVKYGTTEGVYDLDASPTITNVADSPLTVYYQITAPGFFTSTGSETVTILPANPEVPTGLTANIYEPIANTALPAGWSWEVGSMAPMALGTQAFPAKYTPTNPNVNSMNGVNIPVTVVCRNHSWQKPTYEWSSDNSTVTAKHSCFICDAEEAETVTTSSAATKQATCSTKGETTYTAEFKNKTFAAQTKTVADIPINHDAHNWGAWTQITAPTCEGTGTEERVCTLGGSHKETRMVDALGHDWKEFGWAVGEGEVIHMKRECQREGCGKVVEWEYKTTEGHVHSLVLVPHEDATCEKPGTEEHYMCVECQHRFTSLAHDEELTDSQVRIAPLGHNMGAWTQVTKPTCSAEGESERTCTRNGCSYKETRTDAADPYAHEWGAWTQTTAPTCTKAGEDTRVCAHNPSHTEKRVGAAATGHVWGDASYEWSPDNTSVTAKRSCTVCGIDEMETVSTSSEITKQPTCSSKGTKTYTATFTKEGFTTQSKSVEVPVVPEAHEWSSWSVTERPTCTQTGTEVRTCTHCSHEESREIAVDPEAHEWGDWAQKTAPTCKGTGIEERVCAHDPSHKESREIAVDPEAHVWDEWTQTIAPTCEGAGMEERVCTLDGTHKESRMTAALGHDWKEFGWAVGEGDIIHMKRECQREGCGKVVEWEYKAAEGHVHTLVLVPHESATCETPGTEEHYQCIECLHRFTSMAHDEELTDAEVWIVPHGHVWGEWTQTTAPTCAKTGEETRVCAYDPSHKESREIAVDPKAHSWGAWTIVKAATETEEGVEQRICGNDASHVETRTIPKLDPAKPDTPAKKANPLKVTTKRTIKAEASKTTKAKNAVTIKAAQGKVTAKTNNKKVKVAVKKNMKNDKTYKLGIVVKKGLKEGKTYKVKVRIKAAGNANYEPATITKVIRVKVR